MDRSAIPLILRELNLNEEDVANIYHHGSWVYGSNSPTSDRDLMIVIRSDNQTPLKFWSDFDYFHDHQCHKLWNQYDISVYTIENFEILLEKTFLIVVQCLFLPDEFKIKEEIDFRKIYFEKYFNPFKLKQAAFYEMYRYWKLYKPDNDPSYLDEKRLSRRNYMSKRLFHGLRYLDFVEQIIQTQSIHNYKRVTYLFDQINTIRDNPVDYSSMERVAEFVQEKEAEFKTRLDVLVPTNIIKGTFEVQITLDCSHNTEQFIGNAKYKIACIQLDEDNPQQLIMSRHYDGEYPTIVKQIEEEAQQYFQGCNMIRIRIESATTNEGVPQRDVEKKLFWNRTNYFEFGYHVPLEKDRKGEKFLKIFNTCRSKHGFNSDSLDLLRIQLKQTEEKNFDYINVIRLFNVGQEKAFFINDEIVEYTKRYHLPFSTTKHTFVVYDRYFH